MLIFHNFNKQISNKIACDAMNLVIDCRKRVMNPSCPIIYFLFTRERENYLSGLLQRNDLYKF